MEEYNFFLEKVWKNKWLTNRGALALELEEKLKKYLNVTNIIAVNNGTMPLQIALKVLGKHGEIITTPFSYIATTSAIVWENCTPVFVDIHPEYLTIDETKIEKAITSKTTAILATHVFGNPCNIQEINKIAEKYNLKVIYDAAHCFGVKYDSTSIFNYGDVSTCSFHATKIFHTGEGGAMFCKDTKLFQELFYSHNFGYNGSEVIQGLGINAKISELHAAMGLAVLKYMDYIFTERKKIVDYYNENLNFMSLRTIKIRENTDWNYAYYPIILKDEDTMFAIVEILNKNNIFPRRYFFPSLNNIKYVNNIEMPISDAISKRILCLPIYPTLEMEELKKIIQIVNDSL